MIYVPSYKRANNCLTAANYKSATICVHQFEAEEYRKNYPNPVMVLPDEIGGKGMAVIRNYILDHSPEQEIVMLDDDIVNVGFWENEEKTILSEPELLDFIKQGFRMAKELGTALWGLNLLEDKKAYREYSPFSFSSVILGPFFGIIKDPELRFDESLGLKEDYDYSLQVLRKYRKLLRFNKYNYLAGHLKIKGGCAAYRTSEKELEQRQRFIEKWGNRIVSFKKNDTNPVIHCPIKGI